MQQLIAPTSELIRTVGQFLGKELGKVNQTEIETKALNSLVSYVDKAAEQQLVEGCSQILPEAGFITEEDTIIDSAEKEWRWIIDPLDGTTNFLHQLPFFSISVALQHHQKTVMGFVYEVNQDELFYAWKGGGAWLNEKAIQVTPTLSMADSLIATGFPYYDFDKTTAYLKMLEQVMKGTRGVRRLGSAALDLAYTACGRFDAYFEYSLAPWDVAAGAFLVQEAGGIVTDFEGETDYIFGRSIMASNPHLAERMLSLLKESGLDV